MTWKESQCDLIWQQIILTREHKTCELCGSHNNVQAHHVIFRSVCPPVLRYDTRLGACLCGECHLSNLDAPHIDNDLFIDKYLAILKVKNPDRNRFIDVAIDLLKQWTLQEIDIDQIYHKLKIELTKISETAWMDIDMEPEYGRNCIEHTNRVD